jgi:hypothetical protein
MQPAANSAKSRQQFAACFFASICKNRFPPWFALGSFVKKSNFSRFIHASMQKIFTFAGA